MHVYKKAAPISPLHMLSRTPVMVLEGARSFGAPFITVHIIPVSVTYGNVPTLLLRLYSFPCPNVRFPDDVRVRTVRKKEEKDILGNIS